MCLHNATIPQFPHRLQKRKTAKKIYTKGINSKIAVLSFWKEERKLHHPFCPVGLSTHAFLFLFYHQQWHNFKQDGQTMHSIILPMAKALL